MMTHSVLENKEIYNTTEQAIADASNSSSSSLLNGAVDADQFKYETDSIDISAQETNINKAVDQILMPELQGLDILKEGTYIIDPEKTISNMVKVVKKMESQLQSALMLNTHLENDLNDSKEMIIDLRAEKVELENTIKRMQEEIPSKREFQMEIAYLIDERNVAQHKIRDLQQLIAQKDNLIEQYKEKISNLEDDKKDYRIEIEYLIKKLDAVSANNRENIAAIKKLVQERATYLEKITTLEEELKTSDEKRYQIYKELAR
ncbi:MAG: hypothetical protein HQK68_08010 [Desulfamplus sp.]|nr:hypothetical protein [Desulfamplus sp.]